MAVMLTIPALLFAQFNNNTTSPYSRFGLGDLQSYSFGRTSAMGGASLASRNAQQINISNPASYTAVDSLAFLFEFGLNGKFSNYRSDISSLNTNDVNFRYFAMNFQITNWMATSIGLLPYSDIGYDISVSENIPNTGNITSAYFGEGSLSKAYFGLAIEPVKNISVGTNLNYMFGSLNRNAQIYFLDASDFYSIQKYESIRLSDFYLNFGLQATLPLKENHQITFAAVLENKPAIKGFYKDLVEKELTSNQTTDTDTLTPNTAAEMAGVLKMPLSLGFGVSYEIKNSLEINADFYHQSWENANFFGSVNSDLTDLNKFAVGAEWIPDKFSIRSYLNKIAYRAGIKYEQSYIMLNNHHINDFGISFGVGLPIYRSSSTINVSAEVGRRGTKKDGLILENYAKFNLGVNLYDLWFIKRKFD